MLKFLQDEDNVHYCLGSFVWKKLRRNPDVYTIRPSGYSSQLHLYFNDEYIDCSYSIEEIKCTAQRHYNLHFGNCVSDIKTS